MLFVVRWNTLNGKAAALGMFIAAGNTAMLVLRKDDFAFVLRGWYLFVAMFVLAGVHLACASVMVGLLSTVGTAA